MDSRNSNRNSSNHRAHNSVPQARLHHAIAAVCELLEERRLLSLTPDQQFIHAWNNMGPRLRHETALLEYAYPAFQAALGAELDQLGLTRIAPIDGPLPTFSDSRRAVRRKINLFHAIKKHRPAKGLHSDLATPPTVTDVNYYYNQALPNQIAFTFDTDVTASNWNSAVTVIDLNTGATIPVIGTYSSALDTVIYSLNSGSELPDANYAAILHGAQITDTTYSLGVVGSDGVSGDDFAASFYFLANDFDRDRTVGINDYNTVVRNYGATGATGATFTQGDSNYDGSVNGADYASVVQHFGETVGLLGTPATLTTAAAGNTRMEIAWDAPSDPNVTEFDVYRDSTRIATDITATVFLDTSLSPGTTYDYFVVGKDASNDSSWPSSELVTSTPAITSLTVQPPATGVINAGGTYALSTTFADTGALTTHTAVINWGDGTTGTATIVESSNTGTLSGSHEYDGFGAYFGTVAVTDPNGSNAVEVFEVIVPTFYDYDSGDGYTVGQPYTMTPVFSDPDGDTPSTYAVAWGDGSAAQTYSGSTPDFTHTFTAGSTYDATVLATAADGTFTDYPSIDEAAPTLSVSGGSGATDGAAVVITGAVSGSSSSDTYEWTIDWGDGSTPMDVTAGPGGFTYTYADAGTYTVDVNLSDNSSGESDDQELTITVAAAVPTITLSGFGALSQAGNVTFTDSFSDPSGQTLDNLTVDWGDGQTDGYYQDPGIISHDYGSPGTYSGDAIFSYGDGTYDSAFTETVAVDSASVSISSDEVTRGTTYTLNTDYTDPNGSSASQWVINWGDGDTETYGTNPDYGGIFTHLYDPHTSLTTASVTVAITDAYGTYSATTAVSIVDPTPYFWFSDTQQAEAGVPFNVDGTAGPESASYTFTYSIGWGDGSVDTDASEPTFTHEYSFDYSPGASNGHAFTVTASTETGWSATYTSSVEVNAPGDGSVALSGDSSITEGNSANLTANFSGFSPGVGNWVIAWGDGGINDYEATGSGMTHFATSHEYDSPGTYVVEVDGLYNEDSYSSEAVETKTITVAEVTPTLSISSSISGTVVGDNYPLSYSWANLVGQAATSWTIAWGDKTQVIHGNPAAFNHTYTSASNSGTTETITATAVTNLGHTYSASTTVVIAQPMMHVLDGNGLPMGHDAQHTAGAFLPVDDGDVSGRLDGGSNPIPDYSQTSLGTSDPAMLKITFDPLPSSVGGTYSLSWGSSKVTLWNDAMKDAQITSGVTFAASGTMPSYYVEGGQFPSAALAAEQLVLNWSSGPSGRSVSNVDFAKFTVTKIVGARNVPVYGTYSYQPGGSLLAGSTISWAATNGSVVSSDAASAQIKWTTGNAIGRIQLTINGFVEPPDPTVNIVQITVSGNSFSISKTRGFPAGDQVIASSTDGKTQATVNGKTYKYGLLFNANVSMSGPNNSVSKITVGFIDNQTSFQDDGTYRDGTVLPCILDGSNIWLDTYSPTGASRPWYAAGSNFKVPPSPASPSASTTLTQSDIPEIGPPSYDNISNTGRLPGQALTSFVLNESWDLMVCAQTSDGPGNNYVKEADATWSFQASPTLKGPPTFSGPTPFATITPPTGWTADAGGSPVIAGETANQRIKKDLKTLYPSLITS